MIVFSILPALRTEGPGAFRRAVALLGGGFGDGITPRLYMIVTGSLLFLFPFGLIFNLTGILVDRFPWTSSVYILLIALATLLSELRARPTGRVVGEFVVLSAFLWAVEWIGVSTTVPFGEYHYTGVLGLLIGGVPLAIPCAWYATVMNSRRIAERVGPAAGGNPVGVALVAGLLTLALDLVLEPMAAMVKGYWLWSGGSVPLQNYLSWVALSFVAVLLLRRYDREGVAKRSGLTASAAMLYGLQWVLFVVTGVGHGYLVPAVISALLLLALLVFRRTSP